MVIAGAQSDRYGSLAAQLEDSPRVHEACLVTHRREQLLPHQQLLLVRRIAERGEDVLVGQLQALDVASIHAEEHLLLDVGWQGLERVPRRDEGELRIVLLAVVTLVQGVGEQGGMLVILRGWMGD